MKDTCEGETRVGVGASEGVASGCAGEGDEACCSCTTAADIHCRVLLSLELALFAAKLVQHFDDLHRED